MILVALVTMFFVKASARNDRDSLKIFIFGTFPKKESYQLFYKNTCYEFTFKSTRYQHSGCSIKVAIDDSLKDGDLMPIEIFKKRFGKYQDVFIRVFYNSNSTFLILWRDYRQKDKYPFVEKWQNKRPNIISWSNDFWDIYSPATLSPSVNCK